MITDPEFWDLMALRRLSLCVTSSRLYSRRSGLRGVNRGGRNLGPVQFPGLKVLFLLREPNLLAIFYEVTHFR